MLNYGRKPEKTTEGQALGGKKTKKRDATGEEAPLGGQKDWGKTSRRERKQEWWRSGGGGKRRNHSPRQEYIPGPQVLGILKSKRGEDNVIEQEGPKGTTRLNSGVKMGVRGVGRKKHRLERDTIWGRQGERGVQTKGTGRF